MMIKYFITLVLLGLSLIGCGNKINQVNSDMVKMPYSEWRIGGRYPSYFPAKVFKVVMETQSNKLHPLFIAIGPNESENPGKWHIYTGNPDSLDVNADLPQTLYACWVSFVDQTFYSTKIDVPLDVRRLMIIPSKYIQEHTGREIVRYNNAIILGFAPGGNVTAWLAGVIGEQWIPFAQVSSTNLGKNSDICPNPYPDGEIPQISAEARRWLKQYGMPAYWREQQSGNNQ